MPAGDRQRTWFPEMVETLRAGWRAQMSWDDLIALCDRLDSVLQHIRHSRNITPATGTAKGSGVLFSSSISSSAGRMGITRGAEEMDRAACELKRWTLLLPEGSIGI